MQTKTDLAEQVLRQAYPKALSYTEIWARVLQGSPRRDNLHNSHGGSQLRTLCKKGLVKQITTGFYVHTLANIT